MAVSLVIAIITSGEAELVCKSARPFHRVQQLQGLLGQIAGIPFDRLRGEQGGLQGVDELLERSGLVAHFARPFVRCNFSYVTGLSGS
jgi:hypothetical protein